MHTFSAVDKTEQRFAAFMNKGIVYNIMVTEHHRSGGNISAMYIPITSYGCHGNKIHCTYMDSCMCIYIYIYIDIHWLVCLFICLLNNVFIYSSCCYWLYWCWRRQCTPWECPMRLTSSPTVLWATGEISRRVTDLASGLIGIPKNNSVVCVAATARTQNAKKSARNGLANDETRALEICELIG